MWRLLMLLTVVLLVGATVVFSSVAFGAADERASYLGVQRSNAGKGDVGRFSRESAGEEHLGHKGQKAFALQGASSLGRPLWKVASKPREAGLRANHPSL